MKKTIGLIIMIIVMLVALTGCAEINYEVEVHKDGSGEITYIYGISKEVLEQLNVSAEDVISSMKEQAEESSYIVEAYEDENISGFKANKHVEDLTKDFSLQEAFGEEYVKDTENNGIKVEKTFLVTKYSQNAELDLTNVSDTNIKMIYKIKLPTGVKTSNASAVSENEKELTWNLKSGEINEVEFVAKQINILPVVIMLLVICIVVAILVFIILKKKHATKK